MSSCLKPRGRNRVHARLLQGSRFVHGGRRSNQCNSLAAELIQNLFWRNAVNKTEYGDPFVEENLYLIFEANRFVRQVSRLGSSYTFNMLRQWSKAAMKCFFCRVDGSLVFHGDPQVHSKWLWRDDLDLTDDIADSLRFESMSTERSEPPIARNGRRKPLRR